MTVIVGPVLDALGLASQLELRSDGAVRRRCWQTPATELRARQPASRLNLRHDRGLDVGPVVALVRDHGMRCWGVATSEYDVPAARRYYFSAETDATRSGEDVLITAIALVDTTAQTGLAPVTILPGTLDDYRTRDARRVLDGPARDALEHAVGTATAHVRHRDAGGALTVHDLGRPPTDLDTQPSNLPARAADAGWWRRAGGEILAVR